MHGPTVPYCDCCCSGTAEINFGGGSQSFKVSARNEPYIDYEYDWPVYIPLTPPEWQKPLVPPTMSRQGALPRRRPRYDGRRLRVY